MPSRHTGHGALWIVDRLTTVTMQIRLPILLLLLPLAAATPTISLLEPLQGGNKDTENQCLYTLYVETGTFPLNSTHSLVSVDLATPPGVAIRIANLSLWGIMDAGHTYFQRGNLDIFSGLAPCIPSTPCWMNLTSDGSGNNSEWYCNYVDVTVAWPDNVTCAKQHFDVNQCLYNARSLDKLSAIRNYCGPRPKEIAGGAAGRLDAVDGLPEVTHVM